MSYVNLRPKQIFFHQFVHRFSLEFVVCFPKILAVCVMASFGEQNRVSNNQRSTLEGFYGWGMVGTGGGLSCDDQTCDGGHWLDKITSSGIISCWCVFLSYKNFETSYTWIQLIFIIMVHCRNGSAIKKEKEATNRHVKLNHS